jgi:hypothetical protein
MDKEGPIIIEHGDKPTCGWTWLWGRDESDGTRIDRYAANDGYLYERMIPPGGSYCPELQGTVPGREPVWTRIGLIRDSRTQILPTPGG